MLAPGLSDSGSIEGYWRSRDWPGSIACAIYACRCITSMEVGSHPCPSDIARREVKRTGVWSSNSFWTAKSLVYRRIE